MGVLDFFFPKYCVRCRKIGSYICANCFAYLTFDDGGLCLACGRPSVEGMTHLGCRGRYIIDGALASLAYKGVTKKLIYTFKYKPYVTDLAKTIGDLFYEGIIQKELFHKAFSKNTVFVPIPLHSSKLTKRGYNQSAILAEDLAKRFNCSMVDVLVRVKNTKSQFGLKKDARRENMKGAFIVKEIPNQVRNDIDTIFLVDDILTTGSTLFEASYVLKKAGVRRVWGIVLARD